MKYFVLVWMGAIRNRGRTVLLLTTVSVTFLLYGYLSAIGTGLNLGATQAKANRLVISPRAKNGQLPLSYERKIVNMQGVGTVSAMVWMGGIYQSPKNYIPIMAAQPRRFLQIYPEYLLPKTAIKRWFKTKDGLIVGQQLAKKYSWKVGETVPIKNRAWVKGNGSDEWDFTIVGIYKGSNRGTDTTQAFMRYDYFTSAAQHAEGTVSWYVVSTRNPKKAASLAKLIDERFANSPDATETQPETAYMQSLVQQIGNVGFLIKGVLYIAFAMLLLVTSATIGQVMNERAREHGTLRAMGFSVKRVIYLMIVEVFLLFFIGSAIGLGAAWYLASRGDPTNGTIGYIYLPTADVGLGLGAAAVIAAVVLIIPIFQATRMNIAEAIAE